MNMTTSSYGDPVEPHERFMEQRQMNIEGMGSDDLLHELALSLQVSATRYRYGYQQLWCGVPVIRLPDDIVLLQEIIFELRPSRIVETGVARGGSLILNASLMEIANLQPAVLGIDVQIYQHTMDAIRNSRYANNIQLVECDSVSREAQLSVEGFVTGAPSGSPVVLILDSNHSHDHVFGELQVLTHCLPFGSVVIVADTVISEMPPSMYQNRPWSKTCNPLTAIRSFLSTNPNFQPSEKWGRRGLLSEIRDGVLVKTN